MDHENQKSAKKIGEVLAFTTLGVEIFKKSQKGLIHIFGRDQVIEIIDGLTKHKESIFSIIEGTGMAEIVLVKSQKTLQKLEKMQDLYLKDNWDDVTEVMEWLGFFEGAAAIHWGLVERLESEKSVKNLAKKSRKFHLSLLNILIMKIK